MIIKRFFILNILVTNLIFLCFLSFGAHAQDYKPNRKVEKPNRERIQALGYTGIVSPSQMRMSFINKANAPDDSITLSLAMPTPVEGCFDSLPFEIEQKLFGKTKQLEIETPIVTTPTEKKFNHHDCNNQASKIGAEIDLSKKELTENQVNRLVIKIAGMTTAYTLTLNDDFIQIKPENNPYRGALKYWFLPSNTIVLTLPMLNDRDILKNQTTLNMIKNLAAEKGLKPIETILPDYTPSTKRMGRFYFVDPKKALHKTLLPGTPFEIGHIATYENFHGPKGLYKKKKEISVFAAIPDRLD